MADRIEPNASRLACFSNDEERTCHAPPPPSKTPAPGKLYESAGDEPLACTRPDRTSMPNGVTYAEFASAMKRAEAEPIKTLEKKGARGAEITLGTTDTKAEVGTAKIMVGTQNEIAVAAMKKEAPVGEVGGATVKVSGKIGFAQAGAGFHNPDGTTGVNAGAGMGIAELGVSAELQNGTSVGVSAEVGASAGFSFGLKEDGKGGSIACAQANVGPVQVNVCTPTGIPGNTRPH